MKKALCSKLCEKRGSVIINVAIITLALLILLAVSMEIARVYMTIDMLKAKTNSAVLAVASSNAPNVYDGMRESDGLARTGSTSNWGATVSTAAVKELLASVLSLSESNNGLTKYASADETAYTITKLNTQYENNDGDVLNFTTNLTIEIPLSNVLGGVTITQNVEVNTSYDARF